MVLCNILQITPEQLCLCVDVMRGALSVTAFIFRRCLQLSVNNTVLTCNYKHFYIKVIQDHG